MIQLYKRLQTLSLGLTTHLMTTARTSDWLIIFGVIFFAKFWLILMLYLIWIWFFRKEASEKRDRRVDWLRWCKITAIIIIIYIHDYGIYSVGFVILKGALYGTFKSIFKKISLLIETVIK